MKHDYLFINHNNGHMTTYHPFSSNSMFDQEYATKLMNTVPGAGRMGLGLETFLDLLDSKGHDVEYYKCPHCDQVVLEHDVEYYKCPHCDQVLLEIEKPRLKEWYLIEGVTGNY